MAEKLPRKTVSIAVARQRPQPPRAVFVTGFSLRRDKAGLLDVRFEYPGITTERVLLDPLLIQSNRSLLNKYAAGLPVAQDDAALREELPFTAQGTFANIVHFSHLGERAETIFGLFSFADWAEATREASGAKSEVQSQDVLAVFSSTAFQKKLLLEISMLLEEQP